MNLQTLVNCPLPLCPGCLYGRLNKKAKLIDFICNECGKNVGYVDLKHFKKFVKLHEKDL